MSNRLWTPFHDARASLPWVAEPDGPGTWLHFAWTDDDAHAWVAHVGTADEVRGHVRCEREVRSPARGWSHLWLRLDPLVQP